MLVCELQSEILMQARDYVELGEVRVADGRRLTVSWSESEGKVYCGHTLIGDAPSAFEARMKAEDWAKKEGVEP